MDDKAWKRFYSSFIVDQSGCWVWTRARCVGGYGSFASHGKSWRAHRLCYQMVRNVVLSPEQFLHHTCGKKLCINPDHLEITDQLHHVDSAVYGNKEKTHCPHGHEYTPENIVWGRGGRSRECRICKYARIRRRYYRKKQTTSQRIEQIANKYVYSVIAPQ